VLLGMGLPGIDGDQVLSRPRRDTTVAVIVVSGRAEQSERIHLFDTW